MQKNFPAHISSEKDLKLYEEYLENETLNENSNELSCKIEPKPHNMMTRYQNTPSIPKTYGSDMFFQGYLKNHKGKLVRVESLLGNRLETRVGILFEVGANYIVLKLSRNSCSMMIEASAIKYITIIHDNDMNKACGY